MAFVSPRKAMEDFHGEVALIQLGKVMDVSDIVKTVGSRNSSFPSIEFVFLP